LAGVQLGSVRNADGEQRGRLTRPVAPLAVAVLTLVGTVGVTAGPAGSADRKRDQERAAGKRHSQAAADMPARFVAEADGRIVVVSVGTGRVERNLTTQQPGGGAADPAVSPDGRTVWFSRGDGTCAAHLASVPVAGGEEQALPGSGEAGPENQPLPRPGRAQIAFARSDCDKPGEALVIGDVRGLEGYGQTGLIPLAWSRDGNRILAATDVDSSEVRLLDINKAGAIVANRELAPADPSSDCRLEVVGFSPDNNDGYVAIRRCGGSGDNARRSLVLLDKNGGSRKVVLRLPRGLDFVDRIAFDPTGRSVLYSTAPSNSGDSPEISLWLRRDGESRRVVRQSSYRSPSWLP
jgi:dipeptidyl aminopeptidase/acylaminoacyl peptidase